jgi:hypothetical protein
MKKRLSQANSNEVQSVIREHFENPYSNKLENLGGKDKFLDAFDKTKLNQDNIIHLNRFITCKEIEAAIKSPTPQKKPSRPDGYTAEFYQTLHN